MPESSSAPRATTSTVESLILRKLAGVKNTTVATAIGHDESHVSRLASCERGIRICELGPFLDAVGLRIVECDGQMSSLPSDELAALRLLARKALS